MNVPILARDARVGERNVGQGSRRELSRELSCPSLDLCLRGAPVSVKSADPERYGMVTDGQGEL